MKINWEKKIKPMLHSQRWLGLGWRTIQLCQEANTPRLGASLAYYTVFAIAPLFLIALTLAGLWFGEEAARRELFGQLQTLIGTESEKALEEVISTAAGKPKTGIIATCAAGLTIVVATTGVFIELQDAFNTLWKVKPATQSRLVHFLRSRLISFAMVFGVGFLLLVSLVISTGLAAFGKFLRGPIEGQSVFWALVNFGISLSVITVLFAVLFKVLPETKIAWRDVWIGGFLTALLFNVGKFFLGSYLGRTGVASTFGAAGSLVIILLWVYYSAQILFFGAAFTKVYATSCGSLCTLKDS